MHVSMWEKVGFGLLVTAWLIYGGNNIGEILVHADEGDIDALRIAADEDADATAGDGAEIAEAIDITALIASADPAAGLKVFKKCASCHSVEAGDGHKVGPNLYGVVDRAVAGAAGFNYSGALTDLGGAWTAEELAAFLESPKAYAPGNKMTFKGLSKPEQRAAVIAYLQTLN